MNAYLLYSYCRYGYTATVQLQSMYYAYCANIRSRAILLCSYSVFCKGNLSTVELFFCATVYCSSITTAFLSIIQLFCLLHGYQYYGKNPYVHLCFSVILFQTGNAELDAPKSCKHYHHDMNHRLRNRLKIITESFVLPGNAQASVPLLVKILP